MAAANYDAAAAYPADSQLAHQLPLEGQQPATPTPVQPPVWHRIRAVRLQQGASLRSVARHTGIDVRSLRQQELETTDLRLSELRSWQRALGVPLAELLEDSDAPLSQPTRERAALVRVMKTAMAMLEQAPTPAMQRMAETLVDQLTQVMPELQHVGAWPTYGQRRSLDDYGRVAELRITDECFQGWSDDD